MAMTKRASHEDDLIAWAESVLTRRQALQRVGVGVGALSLGGWLAACGSDSKSSGGSVRKGGTVIIGAEEDGYTTTGDEANTGQYPLNVNIFEGLVRMDPSYGIVPVLAQSF
jgi:ABC-type transport system substrate-binding protein